MFPPLEPIPASNVPWRLITPKETQMKKISYVLAALAAIAVAAPAVAQDKPMVKEGSDKPMMHDHMHHHMHVHHHYHHHMMKKPMTDNKM
jgi:hypothetical protein